MGKYITKIFAQKDVCELIGNNSGARVCFSLGIWQLIQVKIKNKNLKLNKEDLYTQLSKNQCIIKPLKHPYTKILSRASLKRRVPSIVNAREGDALSELFKTPSSFEFTGEVFKAVKRRDSSDAGLKGDLIFSFSILTNERGSKLQISNTKEGEVISLKSTIKQKRKRPAKKTPKKVEEMLDKQFKKQQSIDKENAIKEIKRITEERNKAIITILTMFNKSADNIKIIASDMLGDERFYGKTSIHKHSNNPLPLNKIRSRRLPEIKGGSRIEYHIVIYYMKLHESYIFLHDIRDGYAYALKITGEQKQLDKIWKKEMKLSIEDKYLVLSARYASPIKLPLSRPGIKEFTSPLSWIKETPKSIDSTKWKQSGLGRREGLELEFPIAPINSI